MEDRKQSGLTVNPAIQEAERSMHYPMRGIIEAVRFRETARGKTTVVDVVLLDRTGQSSPDYRGKLLTHVPLCYPKMNAENGEEWTPEKGDLVKISFFNGSLRDPVVDGYLGPYEGPTMAAASDPHPQSFRRRSGTSERIDRDGNRITIIKGHENVTVQTGDITVAVVQGKCTVTVKGKTSWTSEGTIEHIGKAGGVAKGNVQADCICPYTRKIHPMVSATVKSSL